MAGWAERLRRLLAWQEALIDFPDEDLPVTVEASLLNDLAVLRIELDGAVRDAGRGAKLRDGLVFAVTGAPNVGKSSLVNALARREIAIVSDTPGTTRDALEVMLELGGVPVTLVDTAGLRETSDPVEAEGVRRARARAASADLIIRVFDARDGGAADGVSAEPGVLLVANKIDLASSVAEACCVSAATSEGLDRLEKELADRAKALALPGGPVLTRARHITALREAALALAAAQDLPVPELRGEELRLAMRALGRITGAIGVEDVLDTVFSAFCIGK